MSNIFLSLRRYDWVMMKMVVGLVVVVIEDGGWLEVVEDRTD